MYKYECPTWGCHGEIHAESTPRHGMVEQCRPPAGQEERRVCRRSMIWNGYREHWQPFPQRVADA